MVPIRSLLLSSVAAVCAAPTTAQVVVCESLTNRSTWKHVGGAQTRPGSSRFGNVDRLGAAANFSYTRTLQVPAGAYRVRFRIQKLKKLAEDPITLAARSTQLLGQFNVTTTASLPGYWQRPAFEFRLTKRESVTFTLSGGTPFRLQRDWLFDSFELVRLRFEGSGVGTNLGRSLGNAGDIDGDGVPDLIVGAQDRTKVGSGSVQVLSGKDGKVLYSLQGNGRDDAFGFAVAGAGDVDGDGRDDFIVGAPRDSSKAAESGFAQVFSGRTGKSLYKFTGVGLLDRLGWAVDGAGDVNGDGHADLIVGMPASRVQCREIGSAQVMSGKDGRVLHTFHGQAAASNFGRAVAGVGDINQDGFADVIIGAPLEQVSSVLRGRARVFSGKDGKVLYSWAGTAASNSFGSTVGAAGDVDRDGVPDLIVGVVAGGGAEWQRDGLLR